MLKKLAIALCMTSALSTGIAHAEQSSSQYAQLQQNYTVDFYATVKAGTCVFSVSAPNSVEDSDKVLNVQLGTIRKDGSSKGELIPLSFNLTACADTLFNSVSIKGDKKAKVSTNTGGIVAFYKDDAATALYQTMGSSIEFHSVVPASSL